MLVLYWGLGDSFGEKLPVDNRNKKIGLIFFSRTPAWFKLPLKKKSRQFFKIPKSILLCLSSLSKKLIKLVESCRPWVKWLISTSELASYWFGYFSDVGHKAGHVVCRQALLGDKNLTVKPMSDPAQMFPQAAALAQNALGSASLQAQSTVTLAAPWLERLRVTYLPPQKSHLAPSSLSFGGLSCFYGSPHFETNHLLNTCWKPWREDAGTAFFLLADTLTVLFTPESGTPLTLTTIQIPTFLLCVKNSWSNRFPAIGHL